MHAGIVGQITASAIRQSLSDAGVQAGTKWPNDVVARTEGAPWRKTAGILIERSGAGRPILGFGVNVNQQEDDFADDLRDQATSVRRLTGIDADLPALLAHILTELERRYDTARDGSAEECAALLDEWRRHSLVLGRHVVVAEPGREPVTALAVDIQPDGSLAIEHRGARRAVHSATIRPADAADGPPRGSDGTPGSW